jgi:hypothetical protein
MPAIEIGIEVPGIDAYGLERTCSQFTRPLDEHTSAT